MNCFLRLNWTSGDLWLDHLHHMLLGSHSVKQVCILWTDKSSEIEHSMKMFHKTMQGRINLSIQKNTKCFKPQPSPSLAKAYPHLAYMWTFICLPYFPNNQVWLKFLLDWSFNSSLCSLRPSSYCSNLWAIAKLLPGKERGVNLAFKVPNETIKRLWMPQGKVFLWTSSNTGRNEPPL